MLLSKSLLRTALLVNQNNFYAKQKQRYFMQDKNFRTIFVLHKSIKKAFKKQASGRQSFHLFL